MASKRVLLAGLGNYTHPQTRHSIGFLLLDYMASQFDLTWSKNKSINAYVTQPKIIYVDPSQFSKQTKLSKKVKKAKKKEWNFGSDSDDDIKDIKTINDDTIIKNANNVIKSADSSRSSSPLPPSSTLLNGQTTSSDSSTASPLLTPISTYKPKKLPDPVPLELTLLKPLLLMNISGKSVSKAARELEFSHSNIIVIHDDLQRELGKISIKSGGSANGHNGVKSVIDHLKTDNFQRLRIGIGRPPKETDDRTHDIVSNFVLSRVPPNEMEIYKNDVFPRCKEELLKACIKNK